jgi:hypothetical protein
MPERRRSAPLIASGTQDTAQALNIALIGISVLALSLQLQYFGRGASQQSLLQLNDRTSAVNHKRSGDLA